MKLMASIVALAVFVNTCYYGIYGVMILRAKYHSLQDRKAPREKTSWQVLRIPVQESPKYTDAEIWYRGELYDVMKRKSCGDSLILELYHDQEEQSVLSSFDELFKLGDGGGLAASPEKKCKANNIYKVQDQIFPSGSAPWMFGVLRSPCYPGYCRRPIWFACDVPSPPPKKSTCLYC